MHREPCTLLSRSYCSHLLGVVAVPQAAAGEALLRAAFQAAPLLQALLAGGSRSVLAAEGRGALAQLLSAVAHHTSSAAEGERVELLQVARSQLMGRLQVRRRQLGRGVRVVRQHHKQGGCARHASPGGRGAAAVSR
jgi:hypothetical protein